jgi:uncharacterized protein (TIGR03643 family)
METGYAEQHRDEIIALALSDEASFEAIRARFGLDESELKRYMRAWLKPGSYRAWRERVKRFRAVHGNYKGRSGRRGDTIDSLLTVEGERFPG